MFKHYNIATVMIDSTILDNLKFLYEITIISKDHSFIRFHRRNPKHRYNYLKDHSFIRFIEEIQNTDTIIAIL